MPALLLQPNNPVYQFLSGVRVTPDTRFLAHHDPAEMSLLREAHHYMHFALAVYGWPMYLRRAGTGAVSVCKLCAKMRYAFSNIANKTNGVYLYVGTGISRGGWTNLSMTCKHSRTKEDCSGVRTYRESVAMPRILVADPSFAMHCHKSPHI